MNIPLVSVIIPLFNAEKYINRALESLLSQSYKNCEIIVVDDGSTDKSRAALEQYKNKITYVYQKNAGASSARNTGLKMARGQYIQFLDADDILDRNKIESQVAILNQNPNCISYGKTFAFYDDTPQGKTLMMNEWYHNESVIYNPTEFLIRLLGGYGGKFADMVQPNAWLCPKQIIEKSGYWDESLTTDDDGEFFARVILNSEGVIYCPNGINFYRKYRIVGGNLSSKKGRIAMTSILSSIDLKAQHLLKSSSSKDAEIAIARQYTFYYYNCYPYFPKLWKEAKKKMLAYGGPTDAFIFGNDFLNNNLLRTFIHWKLLKFLQEIKKGSLKYLFSE